MFPSQDPPPSQPPAHVNNAGKKIIYVFLIVLVLFAIGGISFLIGRQNNNGNTADASPTSQVLSAPTAFNDSKAVTNLQPTINPAIPTSSTIPTSTPTVIPSPTPLPLSKILTSSPALDGFESSNGGGNGGLDIRAGRNANLVTRGFVSFDLTGIPGGAKVTQATLRLYQVKVVGSPYSVGGALKIDHLNYGDTLEAADYSAPALLSSFATLSSSPVAEWKEVDVTASIKDDMDAARSKSQYRIHFVTENSGGDVTGDFVYFESSDNSESTGNTPQLVIKYY